MVTWNKCLYALKLTIMLEVMPINLSSGAFFELREKGSHIRHPPAECKMQKAPQPTPQHTSQLDTHTPYAHNKLQLTPPHRPSTNPVNHTNLTQIARTHSPATALADKRYSSSWPITYHMKKSLVTEAEASSARNRLARPCQLSFHPTTGAGWLCNTADTRSPLNPRPAPYPRSHHDATSRTFMSMSQPLHPASGISQSSENILEQP